VRGSALRRMPWWLTQCMLGFAELVGPAAGAQMADSVRTVRHHGRRLPE
jgi:hypothetical protein